ncbi:phage recombination protein Bet [Streptomyces sp. NBC_00566]|uniref:phage recombination protein Bet n=1 Tax=Streptomyces sp. NBC_00566 TaxID=2975778 RepID=UPI002E81A079|nr:phage recombination protein Bet [Streptomyces sp. NBC_00566]WUB88223.1 phage recombination protein Bet [Streptomyces sp. NBC_00566]
MSAEITKAGGALAIRPDQTEWTPDQAAVLQQSGISNAVTKAELSGFLHLCQRTGLDPFSRQIYLIGRWNKKEQRDVFTPQTGIDGYRVIAQRVTSQTGGTYGYEDTLWCDLSGKWRDVWLLDAPPAAAKVTVIRNGQRFSAVARFSEYVQTFPDGNPKGLWAKMPAGQVAKCAEALALRKAFPHDLAGVYTAEEMAQADNPAAGERHLRKVQPGEGDPWAAPQTAAQGRDYLHEAREAADADAVRRIWREAQADGAVPECLEQIAAVGREWATAARTDLPDDDGVVDGEFVEPTTTDPVTDAQAAEAELRAAAARVGLTTLDADFEQSYGLPISEAGASQLREMAAILGASAA